MSAQSELLCGGAAAAMVMRYWGERGVDAQSFRSLVDPKASGIRTDVLAANLRGRDWNGTAFEGSSDTIAQELQQGRPVIALLEDRPRIYHYVVVVARNADGVVFHDPARAPFRVMSAADFDKRSAAARRWMLVVTPPVPRDRAAPAASSRDQENAMRRPNRVRGPAGAAEQAGGIGTNARRSTVVSGCGRLSRARRPPGGTAPMGGSRRAGIGGARARAWR